MKKKIYISLPISGRDIKKVEMECCLASTRIKEFGLKPVSPLDVSPDTESSYAEHIGRDITAMLGCDGALFLKGWDNSKGCALEMEAARIYGIRIFTSYDSLEVYARGLEYEKR